MTGTDKIIYEHLDSQLVVLQEAHGGFVFHIMGILFLVIIPLVVLMRRPHRQAATH